MRQPVHLSRPRPVIGLIQLFLEVLKRLLAGLIDTERLSQILDVIEALEFGDATGEHGDEERDEEVGVLDEHQVGLAAQFLEPVRRNEWMITYGVIEALEFGDAAGEHGDEERDEEVGVLDEHQVGLAAQLLEPD